MPSVAQLKAAIPAVVITLLVLKFAPDKVKAWLNS